MSEPDQLGLGARSHRRPTPGAGRPLRILTQCRPYEASTAGNAREWPPTVCRNFPVVSWIRPPKSCVQEAVCYSPTPAFRARSVTLRQGCDLTSTRRSAGDLTGRFHSAICRRIRRGHGQPAPGGTPRRQRRRPRAWSGAVVGGFQAVAARSGVRRRRLGAAGDGAQRRTARRGATGAGVRIAVRPDAELVRRAQASDVAEVGLGVVPGGRAVAVPACSEPCRRLRAGR